MAFSFLFYLQIAQHCQKILKFPPTPMQKKRNISAVGRFQFSCNVLISNILCEASRFVLPMIYFLFQLHCCGLTNYTDWKPTPWGVGHPDKLPHSCCHSTTDGVCADQSSTADLYRTVRTKISTYL